MPNTYFRFKQFLIQQDKCAMKVTTDACLFGAWVAAQAGRLDPGVLHHRILDIGAGTGLLSLMLAQKIPAVQIDAIEIEKEAAQQAAENISASPWAEKITLIHADARTHSFPGQYDLIISNPPFYENELKSDKPKKNQAHHSDDLSLAGLLSVINDHLQPGGSFYLLLPYKRYKEIRELMQENKGVITRLALVRQSVNHDHFRVMLAGKFKDEVRLETTIDEIPVMEEKGQYSPAFVELLKDYYLNL